MRSLDILKVYPKKRVVSYRGWPLKTYCQIIMKKIYVLYYKYSQEICHNISSCDRNVIL